MKHFVAIFFVLVNVTLRAQPSSTLTFKEAVKIGLEKNLTLNQAKNNLTVSSAARTAGLLNMAPSVGISGNAGRNDGNSFNQQQGQVVNGVLDFMGANINANMPLFNGLSNVNAFRQATELNNAQLYLVQQSGQDVIRNIASQFLTCLLDQQLVLIQQKNVETQKQQYEQVREQVAAGSRAEVDAFTQEFQLKNAELLLLRAQNTLRNDKGLLATNLQIDPMTIAELEEPNWDVNANSESQFTVDELSELALVRRNDLLATRALEKSSRLSYYSSKGTYLPNVSAFAQYGSQYNYIHPTPDFNPSNRTFESQFFEDNLQLTYGVSFNIPIFGGLATRNTVVRAKMAHENAKLATTNNEITIKTAVMLAQQNYADARVNYEASTAQLRAAEAAYSFEKERYSLGISDIVAISLATQNYTRAQADYASSKYTLMFQRLLLNHATGTLRFEDIP
jgi:outer membrane protein